LTNAAIGVLGVIARRDSASRVNTPTWPQRRHRTVTADSVRTRKTFTDKRWLVVAVLGRNEAAPLEIFVTQTCDYLGKERRLVLLVLLHNHIDEALGYLTHRGYIDWRVGSEFLL
jgi:hypothetical protein